MRPQLSEVATVTLILLLMLAAHGAALWHVRGMLMSDREIPTWCRRVSLTLLAFPAAVPVSILFGG